jgi:hypothetical protein
LLLFAYGLVLRKIYIYKNSAAEPVAIRSPFLWLSVMI